MPKLSKDQDESYHSKGEAKLCRPVCIDNQLEERRSPVWLWDQAITMDTTKPSKYCKKPIPSTNLSDFIKILETRSKSSKVIRAAMKVCFLEVLKPGVLAVKVECKLSIPREDEINPYGPEWEKCNNQRIWAILAGNYT